MKKIQFGFVLLLGLCSTVSLYAADLASDYAAAPPPASPEQAPPIVPQSWEQRFSDACILSFAEEDANRKQGVELLLTLLDERPEAEEVLAFLDALFENDKKLLEAYRAKIFALAKKYPAAPLLSTCASKFSYRGIRDEEQLEFVMNALKARTAVPLPADVSPFQYRQTMHLFMHTVVLGWINDRVELLTLLNECYSANEGVLSKREDFLYHFCDFMASIFFDATGVQRLALVRVPSMQFFSRVAEAYQRWLLEKDFSQFTDKQIGEHRILILNLNRMKMTDTIQKELRKKIRQNPDSPEETVLLALVCLQERKIDESLALLRNGFKAAKTNNFTLYTTYLYMLEREKLTKETDEVLEVIRKSLGNDPKSLEFRNVMIQKFLDARDYSHALQFLEPLQDFSSETLKCQLLYLTQQPGKAYELAKKLFARYGAGERLNTYERNRTLMEMFAVLAGMYRNSSMEEQICLTWLKENPEDDLFLNNLAYIYALRGVKLDEAEKMARAALKNDPENAAYLDTMAWVLYRQKKYAEAVPFIEKAIRSFAGKGEESFESLDHAGDIYHALGRTEDAKAFWQRALKCAKTPQEKDAVTKKLANLKKAK